MRNHSAAALGLLVPSLFGWTPQSVLGPSVRCEADSRYDITHTRYHSSTPHLYRVNFEVTDLKPFPHLAFPHAKGPKIPSKLPSFDDDLMASSSDLAWSMSAMAISPEQWQGFRHSISLHEATNGSL
jgi:hypothetical protein